MIGKVFEIINGIKSDYHSAADNASQYREYQRFYKGGLKEKTLWYSYFIDSLKGRLGGCLRNLRVKVDKTYAKIHEKVSQLRKNKRNGN